MSRVKEFSSVSGLLRYIEDNTLHNSQFVYRGMKSSSWSLSTTYLRFLEQHRSDLFKGSHRQVQIPPEQKLLKAFVDNITINDDFPDLKFDIDSDNTELWELGQHFGLPSPFLDWTRSPYIALFFALHEKPESQSSPAIWTLDQSLLAIINDAFTDDKEKSLSNIQIVEPSYTKNKRVAYQQGLFTRGRNYEPLDTIEDRWREKAIQRPRSYIFQKLVFDCSEDDRLAALFKLDKMNINYRTLFPDVEGSVKYAKQKLILELAESKGFSYSFSS
ncbi:MAG: FRG domain-containing protein [Alteromonas sp.]|jgi:hypothetical protein|uniref:FRG domain-containing protein n=1 Tax=Alteromonas sp. TaxID=232 RepID=UPI0032D8C02D